MTLLVALALIAYNNVLNLWPPFNGPLYVPFNLTLAAILGLLAFGPLDLDAAALGLSGPWPTALLGGLGAAAVVTAPVFLAARSDRWRSKIADRRVVHLRGDALVYQTLVRIPLGTALLEELAFRGVLFGAWMERGVLTAALLSSIAFGLWHISPTLNQVRANDPAARPRKKLVVVAGTVAFTTAAGLLLCGLRESSGTIALPFALHAGVNSLATLAAVQAGRSDGDLQGGGDQGGGIT